MVFLSLKGYSEYITFFCVSPIETFFMKGPSRQNEIVEKIGCSIISNQSCFIEMDISWEMFFMLRHKKMLYIQNRGTIPLSTSSKFLQVRIIAIKFRVNSKISSEIFEMKAQTNNYIYSTLMRMMEKRERYIRLVFSKGLFTDFEFLWNWKKLFFKEKTNLTRNNSEKRVHKVDPTELFCIYNADWFCGPFFSIISSQVVFSW